MEKLKVAQEQFKGMSAGKRLDYNGSYLLSPHQHHTGMDYNSLAPITLAEEPDKQLQGKK